jgi:DNA topoisomerase I
MRIAQRLYEAGHITYMRTDSTAMSPEAQANAHEYIVSTWGKDLSALTMNNNQSSKSGKKSKSDSTQGAHECIRPTRFTGVDIGLTGNEAALYKLIFLRAVQSRMKPAIYDETTVTVWNGFEGVISVLVFAGWRATLGECASSGPAIDTFTKGDTVKLKSMVAKWSRATMPCPYTESTMVKALESNGIGRPSTFASTLEVLYARSYVEIADVITATSHEVTDYKLDKAKFAAIPVVRRIAEAKTKRALIPTDLGRRVDAFLTQKLPDLVSAEFTAQMESQLDEVARSTLTYEAVVRGVCQRLELTI